MPIPKIQIKQDGIRTLVYMDGKQIHGVRGIYFERTAGNDFPNLMLDIIAADMELDCVSIPELPEVFKPFYERKVEMKDGNE